jgi:hypothetical protein
MVKSSFRATELAITGDQGVQAEIRGVHGDRLVWRKELLGQRETNFDVVS